MKKQIEGIDRDGFVNMFGKVFLLSDVKCICKRDDVSLDCYPVWHKFIVRLQNQKRPRRSICATC